MTLRIADAAVEFVGDKELEELLHRVYVVDGFTAADVGASLFAAAAVRARGKLLFARDSGGGLAGIVVVVPASSPARQVAVPSEAEMQLLAVSPEHRQSGIGRALVDAALRSASADGYERMVLRTQPSMLAARRLYERRGFVRAPGRDLVRDDGRRFLVYEKTL